MKIKNLLLGLSIVFALGACSEDEDAEPESGGAIGIDCTTFITEDYLAILEDLTDAQEVYVDNPTTENCQAYYAALNTYIKSWKAYIDECVPQASAQFESYWSTYETYLSDLNCE